MRWHVRRHSACAVCCVVLERCGLLVEGIHCRDRLLPARPSSYIVHARQQQRGVQQQRSALPVLLTPLRCCCCHLSQLHGDTPNSYHPPVHQPSHPDTYVRAAAALFAATNPS